MNDIGSCKIVTGHFKYGLHNFFRRKPRYITFLREPLDRAVSHYYFIKDCDRKKYLHPLRNIADALSLEDFYSKYEAPKSSNKLYSRIFCIRNA